MANLRCNADAQPRDRADRCKRTACSALRPLALGGCSSRPLGAMRLITWNCKGAFQRKHAFASALCPDILIVPECEKLSGVQQLLGSRAAQSFEWFGTNPRKRLAVFSYGDYKLQVHTSYEPSHQWIVPLSVSGPKSFILFAVWTLPLGSYSGRYVRPLLEAFESYEELMAR